MITGFSSFLPDTAATSPTSYGTSHAIKPSLCLSCSQPVHRFSRNAQIYLCFSDRLCMPYHRFYQQCSYKLVDSAPCIPLFLNNPERESLPPKTVKLIQQLGKSIYANRWKIRKICYLACLLLFLETSHVWGG